MNNPRLQRIQDWPQLAHNAKYSVKGLAEDCKLSVRGLERFFLLAVRDSPRRCLKRLRMQKAVELLGDGSNVSETAFYLGYADSSHFSREFKKYYGFAPKEYANRSAKAAAISKMSHSAMILSRLATKS
ncbi:MAG: helix-turn-helix domain-containing protein [Limisphaerales bacterium]